MNKLLLSALLASAALCAAPARAETVDYYLPYIKCTLEKLPEVEPPVCAPRMRQAISEDCVRSGGVVKSGRACELPASRTAAFRKLLDRRVATAKTPTR